ncbi:uncharacterized protein PRCAT00004884001 [Priceomyces carsonii]|uniref:uncharacterized protein n=1 Tax=Priceomyces carsonii TaxID=28549 RepID=UPI002EDAA4D0|nr:unnamed protein product [Priceomyces carsonii]
MLETSEEYKKLLEYRKSGKYVPPSKLRALQESITNTLDSSNEEYQKIKWEELKKSINGQINKLNKSNIKEVVLELFKLNIVRAKGVLVRYLMKAQLTDVIFTPIYASLIAVINSKIPEIGELLASRLVLQFRRAFMKDDKNLCLSSTNFIGHLVNVEVISEILILQILQLLLEKPTDDSVEISIAMIKVVGSYMSIHSKVATQMIFERLRGLLHDDADLSERTQFLITEILKIKRGDFKDYPAVEKELDLVESDDQNTHVIELDQSLKSLDALNLFQFDNDYEHNEAEYDNIKQDILGGSDEEDEESDVENEEQEEQKADELLEIKDMTESNMLEFQKTVYLTMMSSMSADEAVHKLLRLNREKRHVESNDEILVDMIIKCCSQEKTYSKYFGTVGDRLISMGRQWHNVFVKQFKHYYSIIHQFETNALRNIGKFFGHLFASDKLAIDKAWDEIVMTQTETNSASRVFLKFIFQEMVEELGINEVKARVLEDEYVRERITGLFPVIEATYEDADHLRFSINFFTAIGLGILTEEMRAVLNDLPPPPRGRSRSRGSSISSRSESGSYSRSSSGSYSRSSSGSRASSQSRSETINTRD